MVKQWLKVYDEETVKMIGKAFLEEKPLTVRFDEHKIKKVELISILEKEGVTAGEVQRFHVHCICPDMIICLHFQAFVRDFTRYKT